jgi:hypothetical protein
MILGFNPVEDDNEDFPAANYEVGAVLVPEEKEIEWDIEVDTFKEYSTSCPTKTEMT